MLVMCIEREVHPQAACVTIVEHRPLIRALERQAHYAVFDAVVVSIELYVEYTVLIGHPQVQLLGVLRLQVAVAHQSIIEIIECGYPKHRLVEGSHLPLAQGIACQDIPCGTREGLGSPVSMIGHMRVQSAGSEVETSMTIESR